MMKRLTKREKERGKSGPSHNPFLLARNWGERRKASDTRGSLAGTGPLSFGDLGGLPWVTDGKNIKTLERVCLGHGNTTGKGMARTS